MQRAPNVKKVLRSLCTVFAACLLLWQIGNQDPPPHSKKCHILPKEADGTQHPVRPIQGLVRASHAHWPARDWFNLVLKAKRKTRLEQVQFGPSWAGKTTIIDFSSQGLSRMKLNISSTKKIRNSLSLDMEQHYRKSNNERVSHKRQSNPYLSVFNLEPHEPNMTPLIIHLQLPWNRKLQPPDQVGRRHSGMNWNSF